MDLKMTKRLEHYFTNETKSSNKQVASYGNVTHHKVLYLRVIPWFAFCLLTIIFQVIIRAVATCVFSTLVSVEQMTKCLISSGYIQHN